MCAQIAFNRAKLATAAEILKSGGSVENVLASSQLNMLELQTRLVEGCESVASELVDWLIETLPAHELPDSFGERLEALVRLACEGEPQATTELYKLLAERLMKGEAVSVEDLVD